MCPADPEYGGTCEAKDFRCHSVFVRAVNR